MSFFRKIIYPTFLVFILFATTFILTTPLGQNLTIKNLTSYQKVKTESFQFHNASSSKKGYVEILYIVNNELFKNDFRISEISNKKIKELLILKGKELNQIIYFDPNNPEKSILEKKNEPYFWSNTILVILLLTSASFLIQMVIKNKL